MVDGLVVVVGCDDLVAEGCCGGQFGDLVIWFVGGGGF